MLPINKRGRAFQHKTLTADFSASGNPRECGMNCSCHLGTLMPWIKECSLCGCTNKEFDPDVKEPSLQNQE